MLRQDEPAHIVNTASVAGLLSPPAMGIYNASKHAVVALTETLYHDLRNAGGQVGCSLLCPAFVPTGIGQSARARPDALRNDAAPTRSQLVATKQVRRAVQGGRLTPAAVADFTFDAIDAGRFYVITHPEIMDGVRLRHAGIEQQSQPVDPSSPECGG